MLLRTAAAFLLVASTAVLAQWTAAMTAAQTGLATQQTAKTQVGMAFVNLFVAGQ